MQRSSLSILLTFAELFQRGYRLNENVNVHRLHQQDEALLFVSFFLSFGRFRELSTNLWSSEKVRLKMQKVHIFISSREWTLSIETNVPTHTTRYWSRPICCMLVQFITYCLTDQLWQWSPWNINRDEICLKVGLYYTDIFTNSIRAEVAFLQEMMKK